MYNRVSDRNTRPNQALRRCVPRSDDERDLANEECGPHLVNGRAKQLAVARARVTRASRLLLHNSKEVRRVAALGVAESLGEGRGALVQR